MQRFTMVGYKLDLVPPQGPKKQLKSKGVVAVAPSLWCSSKTPLVGTLSKAT